MPPIARDHLRRTGKYARRPARESCEEVRLSPSSEDMRVIRKRIEANIRTRSAAVFVTVRAQATGLRQRIPRGPREAARWLAETAHRIPGARQER